MPLVELEAIQLYDEEHRPVGERWHGSASVAPSTEVFTPQREVVA
jgi:hypothetical protein